ncbi:hypothetical protein LEM8419_02408 [Neolewinella maritima]|uniref:AI-2E family transporter n=1 Tax=Neolewinella maritima TaxID=1383882 RepID=A0ABN8F3F9_9BACT|nr:hypothetical protein [Neolewinella maritima]CAH1001505.1 hypothetical protein LEM8419_02408 [Neolewinella maritima]
MASIRSPFERSPIRTALGIVVALVVLYVLFSIVGWIIALLYRLAPLALVAALIIDYKVVVNYVTGIKNLFQRNWVYGLAASALTVVLYPFVFLYFLGTALFKKKVREARREADVQRHGKWVDYEEVSNEPMDIDADIELLPPPPPEPRRRDEPGYDEYFK